MKKLQRSVIRFKGNTLGLDLHQKVIQYSLLAKKTGQVQLTAKKTGEGGRKRDRSN